MAASKAADKLASTKVDQAILTSETEGQKLWNHVLFGTGTCCGMLAGYEALGVPGDPLPQLKALVSRLAELIHKIEGTNEIATTENE